jgi:hypothetical protein
VKHTVIRLINSKASTSREWVLAEIDTDGDIKNKSLFFKVATVEGMKYQTDVIC